MSGFLRLEQVPAPTGIYEGTIPERMRWLHPKAAEAFKSIAGAVVVSDMFRSAEASLEAIRKKPLLAMPPAYSGHNFGLSIDIDVRKSMKRGEFNSKDELDVWMEARGWYCHRLDGKMGRESWHYNCLLLPSILPRPKERFTSPALERQILALYGRKLELDRYEVQAALTHQGFYDGAIDGVHGQKTQVALAAFQRAWHLKVGRASRQTERVLAYVAFGR